MTKIYSYFSRISTFNTPNSNVVQVTKLRAFALILNVRAMLFVAIKKIVTSVSKLIGFAKMFLFKVLQIYLRVGLKVKDSF